MFATIVNSKKIIILAILGKSIFILPSHVWRVIQIKMIFIRCFTFHSKSFRNKYYKTTELSSFVFPVICLESSPFNLLSNNLFCSHYSTLSLCFRNTKWCMFFWVHQSVHVSLTLWKFPQPWKDFLLRSLKLFFSTFKTFFFLIYLPISDRSNHFLLLLLCTQWIFYFNDIVRLFRK